MPIPISISRVLYLAFIVTLTASLARAEPTVIVNNPTPELADSESAPSDPQIAPPPASPFNEQVTDTINDISTDALANPNSLASAMHPSDAELSAANQELLGRNAQLQRDVNDLETRVNVLINERSGQLFMYGAITVTIALFLGFVLGWYMFGRRDNW